MSGTFAEVSGMILINNEVDKLKKLGWQDPHPWTDKDFWLEILETGSCGIHKGYAEDESYWITDDVDCWPCRPLLIRRVGPFKPRIHAIESALVECVAGRDGDCDHKQCPQLKNRMSHCPLDAAPMTESKQDEPQ